MGPRMVILAYLVLALIGLGAPAGAQAFVGIVKSVEGSATVERNGETVTLGPGMEIQRTDIIKTDHRGHLGLVFSDDTRISMGPDTQIIVDDYLFEPLENRLSLIMRIIRGTVSYLSGQMAKLAPESVRLVMPAATIGVRGTHVLIKVE